MLAELFEALNYSGLISPIVKAIQEIATIAGPFKANLIAWLASAENGITDLFAKRGHFDELCAKKSNGTEVCASGDQLAAILAGTSAGASEGSASEAPASSSAQTGKENADTATSTTSATLVVNGNNPAQSPLNQPWQDNLGALFTHDGQNETVYSTSTIDTTQPGTTTISYWALIPATDPAQWPHTTRTVTVSAPANDNQATTSLQAVNDNPPPTTTATGTDATSTAQ